MPLNGIAVHHDGFAVHPPGFWVNWAGALRNGDWTDEMFLEWQAVVIAFDPTEMTEAPSSLPHQHTILSGFQCANRQSIPNQCPAPLGARHRLPERSLWVLPGAVPEHQRARAIGVDDRGVGRTAHPCAERRVQRVRCIPRYGVRRHQHNGSLWPADIAHIRLPSLVEIGIGVGGRGFLLRPSESDAGQLEAVRTARVIGVQAQRAWAGPGRGWLREHGGNSADSAAQNVTRK
jgi:hypothetical protein